MNDLSATLPQASASSPDLRPERAARRWVKLSVDESLFEHLHIAAAKSGLRITPYLRRHLAQAQPFPKASSPAYDTKLD